MIVKSQLAAKPTIFNPKKMKKIRMKNPYCKRNNFIFSNLSGKNVKRIWDPSKGGIGIKLKIPHIKL